MFQYAERGARNKGCGGSIAEGRGLIHVWGVWDQSRRVELLDWDLGRDVRWSETELVIEETLTYCHEGYTSDSQRLNASCWGRNEHSGQAAELVHECGPIQGELRIKESTRLRVLEYRISQGLSRADRRPKLRALRCLEESQSLLFQELLLSGLHYGSSVSSNRASKRFKGMVPVLTKRLGRLMW